MTYEEIMSIAPGSIVPGGCSVNPNATYMGPGEPILDSDGSALAGGHSVSTNDMIVVLDVGYTKQLALIQYPIGNGEYRQGYIVNNPNNIQYPNIGTNNWVNGSTTETVYLSYEGNQVLGSLDPHESAIFLYKVNDRYNIVYSTDKGFYTKAGFVNYSGGITAQALEGQVLSGGGGSSIDNLPAGSIVPGGRTYPANATAQVDLDLRDAQGNSIPGREVSAGDELTVLDVGYTRQLALVQYPSGESIRQGYITNNDKYIKYKNPNNWYNGSTPEPVLDASGAQIGTINPYESATKLYEANGLTEVVYNTDKGINTKSGFVRYAGSTPNVVHVDIPYPNVTSAELINYGTSGKGRALRAYKIGNGRNSFIYNCAIHGWEDNWPADGVELTKIGNQIIEHFQNNSTGDFTLYVIPAANPDGVSEGWTNNGPGRCTIVGGIDCNRDFPVGFTPGGRARNYTGSEPLNVPESKCLADFIQGVKSKTAGKTYLIDMHGWEQSAIGSSIIGEHFVGKLGLEPKYRYANAGYLIDWANSIGIISALIELPTSTHSHADVVNGNYAGKIIEGLTEIMGTSSSSTGGNYNGKINSGVSSVNVRQEPNTSSTILGQLHGNDGIEILGKIKPSGDTYYWYRINYNGTEGYVRSDFVTATVEIPVDNNSSAEEPFNKSGKVINVTTVLNIRKGPGVSYDIIGTLKENNNVLIVSRIVESDGYWYKIKFESGFGYVRSDFIELADENQSNLSNETALLEIVNDSLVAKLFSIYFDNIPQEKVVVDNDIFKVSLILQAEQDITIGRYKLQLLNGNVAGIITPSAIGPKWLADKLTNDFGIPGNGTFLDIQKILEVWQSKDGKNEYELDFEFSSTDEGKIVSLTYEMQHFTKNTPEEVLAFNFLVKIDINLSKLNIIPGSYEFTHNFNQVMEDALVLVENELKVIGSESNLIKTLCGSSIAISTFILSNNKINLESYLDKGEKAAIEYINNFDVEKLAVDSIRNAIIAGVFVIGIFSKVRAIS